MGATVMAIASQRDNPAERTPAVILFAELRNFTSMSEMLDAARVLALADQFFDCAAAAVQANGGEVIAVHNDSLLAAFRRGTLAAQGRSAVLAAQRMATDFDPTVQSWQRDYGLRAAIALGVHLGDAVFGEAGPAVQRNAVVFGDCVSIAERLVHRARAGEIVLSTQVAQSLGSAAAELGAKPLPPLELHNRPPIRIYGVLRDDRLDFTS